MLALAPGKLPKPDPVLSKTTHSPHLPGKMALRGRVIVMQGCAQRVLDPAINLATIKLLTQMGIEVLTPQKEGCCGALVHHMGREEQSHADARRNIDAWLKEEGTLGLDAIIITTSGCGTTVKDYGHMLRNDPEYAEKAVKVSALAKDVTEYLSTLDLPASKSGTGIRVAYHSAC
jgi:glycolate oxidase iron-sulfur subunit